MIVIVMFVLRLRYDVCIVLIWLCIVRVVLCGSVVCVLDMMWLILFVIVLRLWFLMFMYMLIVGWML